MIKRFIHWTLGYSIAILLLGVGLLGMAAYSSYKASVGGKIPPETELIVQSGKVTEGREITVERRRHRSGSKTTRKYYELDLQPTNGEPIKLRVDFTVPRHVLEQVIDEDVTVKYDKNDDNTTYVIQSDGKDLVSYAKMAEISQLEADAEKASFTSSGSLAAAIIMILLGGGGLFLRRKLAAGDSQDDNDAVVPPSEVNIGANVKDNPPAFDKDAAFQHPPEVPTDSLSKNQQEPKA